MDDGEDEELIRAIALSLRDAKKPIRKAKKPEVINLISDSEDDEDDMLDAQLQRALDVSRSEARQTASQPSDSKAPTAGPSGEALSSKQPRQPPNPLSSFLAERVQLEKERRERQKRLRPDIERGDEAEDHELKERPAKRQHISSSSSSLRFNDGRNLTVPSFSATGSPPNPAIPTIDQVFPEGELRQTANYHADPRRDGKPTFRLTEILGKKTELAFAILSSYSLDLPWTYQFFDPSVPVIIVAQPDENGQASLKNVLPNWIRTTPYLRSGWGCMHMKFMLLFYKTGRLRVVISTANLIDYDYRDMENTIWLQDLPLRGKAIPHDPKEKEDFPSVLQRTLYNVNVGPALKTMLKDQHPDLPIKAIEEFRMLWDWSKVKVHLVPSIAGAHEGWPKASQTGHLRLMKVVRNLGLHTINRRNAKKLQLECQGSSLGSYTTQWFNEFHYSARGESAEDWLDEPKKRRSGLPYPSIKIVYPTKQTVQKTKLGEAGGGTVFCRRKQWAAKNFPRDHFYDSKSKGGPVLMHSKMIIATFADEEKKARGKDTDGSDDEIQIITPAHGWAYIGSHNFTPSAWGTLSGSSFNPTLNVVNYELGIVIPLRDKEDADRIACFERPPKKYTPEEEPWIQEESIYHQDE